MLELTLTKKEHEILKYILMMDDLYSGISSHYGKDYTRLKDKIQKAPKKKYKRVCRTCGDEFKGEYNQIYCSEECLDWDKTVN